MNRPLSPSTIVSIFTAVTVGCFSADSFTLQADTSADAGQNVDAMVVATADATTDATADAMADATADAMADATADAMADATADAMADAGNPLVPCAAPSFRHAGTGKCVAFTVSMTLPGKRSSNSVKLALLNGDMHLDAFVANDGGNRVWFGDGQGRFADSGQSLGNLRSEHVSLADVDQDQDIDAFVANRLNSNTGAPNAVWINDGNGQFSSQNSYGRGESYTVALADLNGDTYVDAFVANDTGTADMIWFNEGTINPGSFRESSQIFPDLESQHVALANLDQDQDIDAYIATATANLVWINSGNGIFTSRQQTNGSADSLSLALTDLDNDQDVDVVVANWRSNSVSLINDGTGNFNTSHTLNTGSSNQTECVSVADLDGDGDMDVVLGNQDQPNTIWLNDGTGAFTFVGEGLGRSDTHDIALADLDSDGYIDAFVVNDADHNARMEANQVWFLREVP